MADRALVVGVGVIGLSCALALARRGFAVSLIGNPSEACASSVAAGMLAPAAEAALDPHAPPYPLMVEALAMWPDFATAIGATLHRCGSLVQGATREAFDFAGDARVDVRAALIGLANTCANLRVSTVTARARFAGPEAVTLASGESLAADAVVLAAGWSSAALCTGGSQRLPLKPVRGQLVRFAPHPGLADAAMIRMPTGYLCPSAEGLVSGATMEAGVAEAPMDKAVAGLQAEVARTHFPVLRQTPYAAHAGVRADTPDQLPFVGPLPDGPLVATGMRRNGWLLAPLVAEMIAAYAVGEDPGPWADILSPARFS